MNTVVEDVKDMPGWRYRACYAANYGKDGFMRPRLVEARQGLAQAHVVGIWEPMAGDNPSALIGWSLVTPLPRHLLGDPKYSAMFWVKAPYRRQGFGRELMEAVRVNFTQSPLVEPHTHNRASVEFLSHYPCIVTSYASHLMPYSWAGRVDMSGSAV